MSALIQTLVAILGVTAVMGNVVPFPSADAIIVPDSIADASEISHLFPNFTPTYEVLANLTSVPSAPTPSPTEPIIVTSTATAIIPSSVVASTIPTLPAAPVSALTSPLTSPSSPVTPEAAETIQVVQSSVLPPVKETDQPIMDIIQKGLTRLRHAGDRLRKFIEKIEDGIKNGAVSQTIESVKAKIESGKVDLHHLISAYKHQSPMNFEDLIRRISDDTHILLDKLHGRVDVFGAYNKDIPHDASDESAEDHHLTLHPIPQSSVNAKASPTPNSVP
ncbi:unnamed protein product [Allacma fusca]|uniref:Uncharacterized protein n=1 Tax=Allacma fusca TaxID=39272 RepID=A0A8J2P9U1_9HEXA|nr:unnamed protein product [Allacma fusca]